MKRTFNLIYKSGPHGDECTTYKLEFAPNITLETFINDVISDNLEWGKIYIGYINTNISNKFLFNKYKDTIIENNDYNWSNGGWSCMDYWIKI